MTDGPTLLGVPTYIGVEPVKAVTTLTMENVRNARRHLRLRELASDRQARSESTLLDLVRHGRRNPNLGHRTEPRMEVSPVSNPNRSNSAICPREKLSIDHSKVVFARSGREGHYSNSRDDLLRGQELYHLAS